jgi:endonuclease/exonuclease/phosphatase family metal-dependent hydrolase
MSRCVFHGARVTIAGVGLMAGLAAAAPASAQTTVVLDAPGREVVDTTIRGGSYANANFDGGDLETRASDDRTYVRRALLKFDTENFVPVRATIRSATLTLTVKGGNAQTRTLGAYRIAESFDENAATWNDRKAGLDWRTTGASLGSRAATATVTRSARSKVSFNVTALVQATVNGSYGSRYTRVAVIDGGSSSRDSYRQFYSSETSDPAVRPTLTIVYGGGSTSSGNASADSVPPPSSSGRTLRVFHWNLHHGVGTDGRYDINRIATSIAKSNPDVVSLNEVEKNTWWGNEDQPARYKALLQAKTGRTWYAVWAQEFGDWNSAGKGNLILSRYPWSSTARSLFTYDRTIALGQISVGGRNITFASTHLDPDSGSRRLKQAKELASWADNFADGRIVCGDMNAQPTSSEMTYLKQTYKDAWDQGKASGIAHSAPDNKNGYTRNSRIDFCLASKSASHLSLTRVEVVDTRDAHGVRPSDHRPILAIYSVR